MKTIIQLILATAVTLCAHAASLDFVKTGESYNLNFGTAIEAVVVVSNEGGGWYRCQIIRTTEVGFVNFNQALLVMQIPKPDQSSNPVWAPRDEDMRRALMANFNMLMAASNQYFLEHQVGVVNVSELVGPTKLIKQLHSIDGENYNGLVIRDGQPIVIHMGNGAPVSSTAIPSVR